MVLKSTLKKILTSFILAALAFAVFLPNLAKALQMPDAVQSPAGILASAYIVINQDSGEVLAQKNQDQTWVPASLTKLVTALVFLDTNPNWNKSITMQKSDQIIGGCSQGGGCLSTKAGVAYKTKDLFYSSLMASHNNSTAALARSTGLSTSDFAAKMNEKAAALGATNSYFVEPTGMSTQNSITAADYAKIAEAAFQNSSIKEVGSLTSYSFKSTNNKKYVHTIKNTDKLLGDDRLSLVAAKTGYLEESGHNFAALLKDQLGNNLLIVLLGSANSTSQFHDTRQLAALGTLNLAFNKFASAVLGTSTAGVLKN